MGGLADSAVGDAPAGPESGGALPLLGGAFTLGSPGMRGGFDVMGMFLAFNE